MNTTTATRPLTLSERLAKAAAKKATPAPSYPTMGRICRHTLGHCKKCD